MFVNIHTIQTLPPSNINRDQDGNPKTMTFGETLRHSPSSQSFKKAIRNQFTKNSVVTSIRTKRIHEIATKKVIENHENISLEDAQVKVLTILEGLSLFKLESEKGNASKLKIDDNGYARLTTVYHFTQDEIDTLAELAVSGADAKEARKSLTESATSEPSPLDTALFGRMVASDQSLSVDAAANFSRPIATHAFNDDMDFFVATDDFQSDEDDNSGSSHIGERFLTSSTLYRHVSVSVDLLKENLGTESVVEPLREFFKAFVQAMPTGNKTTMNASTLPTTVIIEVQDQLLTAAGAFADTGQYLSPEDSATSLVTYLAKRAKMYDFFGETTISSVSQFDSVNDLASEFGISVAGSVGELLSDLETL